MKKPPLFPFLFCFLIGFFASCEKKAGTEGITIAATASTQFMVEALRRAFTERTGIPTTVIIGSSGKLTAQITEGAPYDLFLSADARYTDTLAARGYLREPPLTYAYGLLVLWSLTEPPPTDVDSLLNSDIQRIAVANPATAPYGQAAIEVLRRGGLEDQLRAKLVFGESIAQVNHFVVTGSVEVGFTALSVVRAPHLRQTGHYRLVDVSRYSPLPQTLGIIRGKDPAKRVAAVAFRDFVLSESGQQICLDFGYQLRDPGQSLLDK